MQTLWLSFSECAGYWFWLVSAQDTMRGIKGNIYKDIWLLDVGIPRLVEGNLCPWMCVQIYHGQLGSAAGNRHRHLVV